ncbi:hypothetical protein LZ554_005047 [Drepanopeziza brunnea f. sp. 'monogermtubi']|nr:hypothetical protein LZ554_005047 [Drepanopeziza brunnea f. sp. 'monogermtubi']
MYPKSPGSSRPTLQALGLSAPSSLWHHNHACVMTFILPQVRLNLQSPTRTSQARITNLPTSLTSLLIIVNTPTTRRVNIPWSSSQICTGYGGSTTTLSITTAPKVL